MCATSASVREKKDFIFHLLPPHHYDNVYGPSGAPSQMQLVVFRWNDMCLRCRARFLSGCTQAAITSHDEPAWPPAAGVGFGEGWGLTGHVMHK